MPYLALHPAHVTLTAHVTSAARVTLAARVTFPAHVTFAGRVTFTSRVTFAARLTSAACNWSLSLPSIFNLTLTKHPLQRAKKSKVILHSPAKSR